VIYHDNVLLIIIIVIAYHETFPVEEDIDTASYVRAMGANCLQFGLGETIPLQMLPFWHDKI